VCSLVPVIFHGTYGSRWPDKAGYDDGTANEPTILLQFSEQFGLHFNVDRSIYCPCCYGKFHLPMSGDHLGIAAQSATAAPCITDTFDIQDLQTHPAE
jgi:hypothetical protein